MYKIQLERMGKLPAMIRSFCFNNEGWIVGSGAMYMIGLKEDMPRDWDILIPFYEWGKACLSIPRNSPSNSFGGIKIISDEHEIDVWGGDIGWFLGQVPNYPAYAVSLSKLTTLEAHTGNEKPSSQKQNLSSINTGE
jgi:hypothetical protein